MIAGGNYKLDFEAAQGPGKEGSVSVALIYLAVVVIAAEQLGGRDAAVGVHKIVGRFSEGKIVAIGVPYVLQIEGIYQCNERLGREVRVAVYQAVSFLLDILFDGSVRLARAEINREHIAVIVGGEIIDARL